jgi:hypothetical protein
MITLQIIGTDIEYLLPDDRVEELAVKARLQEWHHDTKILIVETGEIVDRDVLFENKYVGNECNYPENKQIN